MTKLIRLVLASLAVAACSQSAKSPETQGAAAQTSSAAGTLAPSAAAGSGAVPNDTISERADKGRIAGDQKAPVWVIMLSDFQCPYCKAWHDAQFSAVQTYAAKGKIALAFINLPLSMHQNAMPAAEAAMCAAVQNKFWPMHEALFTSQTLWAELPNPSAKFDSLAASLGLDVPLWRTCVTKHLTQPLIEADRDRARTAGASSTPTFIVDGKMMVNAQGQSLGAGANVVAAIDAALAKR